MWRRIAVAAAVAAVSLAAAPVREARAQGATQLNRDAEEVKNYRLTMAKIHQLAKASEALARAMQADPRYQAHQKLKGEIDALEKKDELSEAESNRLEELRTKLDAMEAENDARFDAAGDQSLDGLAKRIESEPVMAGAIRSAGMTPREYSLVNLALFQAMMAHEVQKSLGGKELPQEVTEGAVRENVKFIAENEAEITKVMERLKALEKKP